MLLITLPAEVVSVCEVFSLKIFLLRRNFANFLSAFFVLVQARVHNRKSKAHSTLSTSQPVPQVSTTRALLRLTSEVERDLVHLERYGRRRQTG